MLGFSEIASGVSNKWATSVGFAVSMKLHNLYKIKEKGVFFWQQVRQQYPAPIPHSYQLNFCPVTTLGSRAKHTIHLY